MPAKSEQLTVDKVLVDRFKKGDQSAFDEIISRYWNRIFNRAYQFLKNRQDAEEVTQDTFVKAHKGLEKFRGDAAFSTWLFQIATNLAHNKYWYWWRRKAHLSFSLEHQLTTDGEFTLEDVLPSTSRNPQELAITDEFVERVRASMKHLNAKHREILTLRNIQELSYEEIATRLNITIGTVKSRIARARENLREKVGENSI